MSTAKKFMVKRFQRGGGKKEILKACPVSEELKVAETMMRTPRNFEPDWWYSNWEEVADGK